MKFGAAILLAASAAAYEGCNGVSNQTPVLELEPQLLGQVENGSAWLMKQDSNVVYIAKVSGNAYEMGYAQGQLLGKQIAANT